MEHFTGWYWCSKNNWDGNNFDFGNLVSIEFKKEDYNQNTYIEKD
jgi:hypothetical protein